MRRFNPQWLNKPRKKDNLERRLQLSIIKYLKARGYAVGKIKSFGLKNRLDIYMWRGLPDLLIFTPKLYFLEIKANKNTLSPAQKDFQYLCNKANIPYIVVRSIKDVESI